MYSTTFSLLIKILEGLSTSDPNRFFIHHIWMVQTEKKNQNVPKSEIHMGIDVDNLTDNQCRQLEPQSVSKIKDTVGW